MFICNVWLCLCSYASSVATAVPPDSASNVQDMDYLDQLDENFDISLVALGEFMPGYKPQ